MKGSGYFHKLISNIFFEFQTKKDENRYQMIEDYFSSKQCLKALLNFAILIS